ncbi:MAG: histidine--tRNA ligase [Myxococcota bacterium]|nr:histidine--tRNA ligase [Myxococcota bacterium]
MNHVKPQVLKGFRDYLPDVMGPREAILQTVGSVFRTFGFAPLATPAIEYSEVILGKYGTEGDQLLYRFLDNGGRDVALRYDLTVPLARVMGQHKQLLKPFRRYQIAPVWRAEKPGKGRFREFVQCDVDIVGADSLLADFECIQVGVAVLQALGVPAFVMRINDRRILDGLMARVGVNTTEMKHEVLRSIDKLPKVGWDAVRHELAAKISFSDEQLSAIHTFLHGDMTDLSEDVVDLDIAGPGLQSLKQLLGWADDLGIRHILEVDLSIARGLDYYTSTIYETFITSLPAFGSVMSGGRYDGLLSLFSKEELPAVGISLGVDRLLAGLQELGVLPDAGVAPQVFVTVYDASVSSYAQRVAQEIRSQGLRVQLHLQPGQKFSKQFKAASRCGAEVVVIAGPDESAKGCVSLKRLSTGEQLDGVLLDSASNIISDWLQGS